MQLKNETVYDTNDLAAFISWVTYYVHECESAYQIDLWLKAGGTASGKPQPNPSMRPLSLEPIRIGYYRQAKRKGDDEPADLPSWDSFTSWQRGRLGIVRPAEFPLADMQVVALAVATKDERAVPEKVKLCLAKQICFAIYPYRTYERTLDHVISDAPPIRWDDNPVAADVEGARKLAHAQAVASAERAERLAQYRLDCITSKLTAAKQKLAKTTKRLAQLRGGQ